MTEEAQYSLSFTTASARPQETLKIAQIYGELQDWKQTRQTVIDENLLQQRTVSSRRKLYQELASRLKCLSDEEITFLVQANNREQMQVIWLAICRRYSFIKDFAIEVVHEAVLTLKPTLTYADYNSFYVAKTTTHPELEQVADSTTQKIRQVIFRMLSEVQILDSDNTIKMTTLSSDLKTLMRRQRDDLRIYPIHTKVENA